MLVYSNNLDIFLSNNESNGLFVQVPNVPKLESSQSIHKTLQINFFNKSKNVQKNGVDSNLQDFNLNQLTVVGVMDYKKKEYAFLKTPYETILVKVGDTIKNAKIIKININNIELEEVQMQDNKVYKRKIYLKFNLRKNDNLISKVN